MVSITGLSESIRTTSSDKLLRTISLNKMHNSLIDLFSDRTAIDNDNGTNDEDVFKVLRYSDCLSLNDESTIKFHQSQHQQSDVFDEQRQIWIDEHINPIEDDLFIPRSDAQ